MSDEIKINNGKIARFMGYELITPAMRRNPTTWSFSYWEKDMGPGKSKSVIGEHRLFYHCDWNMIMSVVEKIGKLHHEAWPTNEKFIEMILANEQPVDHHYMDVVALPLYTPITDVFDAVIKFIDWYNAQNKTE